MELLVCEPEGWLPSTRFEVNLRDELILRCKSRRVTKWSRFGVWNKCRDLWKFMCGLIGAVGNQIELCCMLRPTAERTFSFSVTAVVFNGECRVLLCNFSDKSCEGRKTFLFFSAESSTFIRKRFVSFLFSSFVAERFSRTTNGLFQTLGHKFATFENTCVLTCLAF